MSIVADRLLNTDSPSLSAASAQSRTGVLLLVLSITLLVVGVQWLVISPREPEAVDLVGRSDFAHWDTSVPTPVLDELQWACAAFLATDRVKTVALWRGGWLAIQGVVAQELDVSVAPGPLLSDAMARETANSISNLPLFPGRIEFARLLPPNIQSLLIQPMGREGVMLLASNRQRGFSSLDKAWAVRVAEKLGATFDRSQEGLSGASKPVSRPKGPDSQDAPA
ncbi:CCB4 [Auxenochlorella protothecoides x Auxenochlorella symbiontica]